ncbi:PRKR-interacting protein 1 homolog [Stylophora pistillata]|uniref:PRKR-interacting protein 1-like n=1 Tax=Stylophora pistillata TaxID=50429 RepID=A0A2B4SIU3_STYPI|nr:PRKR-interacting protein 1 homolog [Stylophora pistillata]PFX28488.1 PRKR-interacting protein 1-like [Stylophora pistillata]
MADESGSKDAKKNTLSEKPVVPRNPTEIQRMKLEKLWKDPDKTVSIPDRPKEWKPSDAPEFIRFVMGSSAGAGSGEFHVYRATRRREYNRTAYIEKKAEEHELDESFHKKLEENQNKADEKTAKKRAKRQKKKQRKLNAKRKKDEKERDDDNKIHASSSDDDDQEEENEPHFVIGGK